MKTLRARRVAIAAFLVLAAAAVAVAQPVYHSPVDLAVTADGSALAVVCSESDRLLVLDLPGGGIRGEVAVGHHPSAVALSSDGRTAWVASREDDVVHEVDLDAFTVRRVLPAGWGPEDVAVDRQERRLLVANGLSQDISIVDLAGRPPVVRKRLRAGESPRALALSPDGRFLWVANLLSRPHPPEEPPVPELTLIDLERERVVDRVGLPGANLVQGLDVTPDGTVLLALIRPKNLVPLIQVAGGWTIVSGVALVSDPLSPPPSPRPAKQLLLDAVGRHYADPTAVAVSPDGGSAWVTAGGADELVLVDLSALRETAAIDDPFLADRLDLGSRFIRAVLPTGPNPFALALAPDGRRLYVADRLGDTVTVVDTAARRVAATLSLGGPEELTPERRGERNFFSAAAAFDAQFSCASCHPDGAHDGLVYDISPDGLGRNFVDTRTLLGVRGTAPFKWSGLNPDLHTQCGPRAAKFIMRSPGYTPDELDDLVAYEASLPLRRNRRRSADGRLTPLEAWGKRLFERDVDNEGQTIPEANRCSTCHAGPRGTNNRAFDVGTAAATDKSGLIDTPPLNNLIETAPYLHDGRALTLEELWTTYNREDRHGRANDMGKDELNALIEYLKTL